VIVIAVDTIRQMVDAYKKTNHLSGSKQAALDAELSKMAHMILHRYTTPEAISVRTILASRVVQFQVKQITWGEGETREAQKVVGQIYNQFSYNIESRQRQLHERNARYHYFDGSPRLITDEETGDQYLNETDSTIRWKGLALIPGSLLIRTVLFPEVLAKRLAAMTYGHKPLKQLLLILFYFPIVFMMFLSAIYTVISPHDGRKMYASWERLLTDDLEVDLDRRELSAPCFQPRFFGDGSPGYSGHLFGGDEYTKDSW